MDAEWNEDFYDAPRDGTPIQLKGRFGESGVELWWGKARWKNFGFEVSGFDHQWHPIVGSPGAPFRRLAWRPITFAGMHVVYTDDASNDVVFKVGSKEVGRITDID